MKTHSSKSFVTLLWDVLRLSARAFWQSTINPARPFVERQQALAVLGLPSNATPQQIKRRYRALAKRFHPDCGGDPQKMQQIIAAYEFLMKEQARTK
jgi:preprotein translocase subunit Sec63